MRLVIVNVLSGLLPNDVYALAQKKISRSLFFSQHWHYNVHVCSMTCTAGIDKHVKCTCTVHILYLYTHPYIHV